MLLSYIILLFLCLSFISSIDSLPRRLIINGSKISEPETPLLPTKLRGFNIWVALDQHIELQDKAITTVSPDTNMVRLVMVHWQDAESILKRGSDCYISEHPFIKPACLEQFDTAVEWATSNNIWTVLTGRAKGGPDGHVFNNDTLRTEMISMWTFLSKRYANVNNILGYEVLAEPRTLNATLVHNFHVDACNAVWEQDSLAACLIGAGKFYDRYQLDERFIIKNRPVIYAANYLTPKKYTKGDLHDITYPGAKIKCGDLVAQKEVLHACPNGDASATITFNKDFLSILAKPFSDFKNKYNVPLWVDQWGIDGRGIGGGNTSIIAYMTDALDLWDQGDFLWTQWIWRSPYYTNASNYGIIYTKDNVTCGSFYGNKNILKPLSKYLGGDGGASGKPLPTTLSQFCKCINFAKEYCGEGTAAECKKCVWQHKSDLISKGCDWNATHSKIVSAVCQDQDKDDVGEDDY